MKKIITLTEKQSLDILSQLQSAKQLFEDFLMHDDWKEDASKDVIKRTKSTQKRFEKTISMFIKKCRGTK